jgi:hypothetical protein
MIQSTVPCRTHLLSAMAAECNYGLALAYCGAPPWMSIAYLHGQCL